MARKMTYAESMAELSHALRVLSLRVEAMGVVSGSIDFEPPEKGRATTRVTVKLEFLALGKLRPEKPKPKRLRR